MSEKKTVNAISKKKLMVLLLLVAIILIAFFAISKIYTNHIHKAIIGKTFSGEYVYNSDYGKLIHTYKLQIIDSEKGYWHTTLDDPIADKYWHPLEDGNVSYQIKGNLFGVVLVLKPDDFYLLEDNWSVKNQGRYLEWGGTILYSN